MRTISVVLFLSIFLLESSIIAAQMQLSDFRNLENFVDKIVSEEINHSFPDLKNWSSDEKRQIYFSQLASVLNLKDVLKITDSELQRLKSGESQLRLEQIHQLIEHTTIERERWVQKFIDNLSHHKPPKSKTWVLTKESMKGLVALQFAFLGGVLMGTGIVPFDSSLGEVLGPVSIIGSIIAVTRPLKVMNEFTKIDIETKNFNNHLQNLHKNSEIKVPSELLSLEFLIQNLEFIKGSGCSDLITRT